MLLVQKQERLSISLRNILASKINSNTPTHQIWNMVRKIQGKNICQPAKGSMKSFICRGCVNPVTGTGRTSVDIGGDANLELVDKFR